MFRKILLLLGICSAITMTGCSSLPDGSQKPFLQINSLTLAGPDQEPGFNIAFTMEHRSIEPLQIKEYKVDVFVNGTKAASHIEDPKDLLLKPGTPVKFKSFIKANLLNDVAAQSLQKSSYVVVDASCVITVVFDKDEDNYDFNPTGSFEGLITHV